MSPGIPYQLSNCIPNTDAAGMLLHINAKFQWENINQLFFRKVLFLIGLYLFILVKTSNVNYKHSIQKPPMSIGHTITIMAYRTFINQHANRMNKNIHLPSRTTAHPITNIPIWSIGHRIPILANASWSYGSLIYNYLCNQCASSLKLWVRTPFMARCTLCNIL